MQKLRKEPWLFYVAVSRTRQEITDDMVDYQHTRQELLKYRNELVKTMIEFFEEDEYSGNVYVISDSFESSSHVKSVFGDLAIFSGNKGAKVGSKFPLFSDYVESLDEILYCYDTIPRKFRRVSIVKTISNIRKKDPKAKVIYLPVFVENEKIPTKLDDKIFNAADRGEYEDIQREFDITPVIVSKHPHFIADKECSHAKYGYIAQDDTVCPGCPPPFNDYVFNDRFVWWLDSYPFVIATGHTPAVGQETWVDNQKVPTDKDSSIFKSFMNQLLGTMDPRAEIEYQDSGKYHTKANLSDVDDMLFPVSWLLVSFVGGGLALSGFIAAGIISTALIVAGAIRVKYISTKMYKDYINLAKIAERRFHKELPPSRLVTRTAEEKEAINRRLKGEIDYSKNTTDGKKSPKALSRKEKKAAKKVRKALGQQDYSSAWDEVDARHQKIVSAWLEYEMDLKKALEYPVMLDTTDPVTSTLVKLVVKTGDIKSFEPRDVMVNPIKTSFYNSVLELEAAFTAAENNAKKISNSIWNDLEKKKVETAKSLHALVMDDSASSSERQLAYDRLFKTLDGVMEVPAKSKNKMRESFALIETA